MQKHIVISLIVFLTALLMTGCGTKNSTSVVTPSLSPSISAENNSSTDVESPAYISISDGTYLALTSKEPSAEEFAGHIFATYEALGKELDSSKETSALFAINNSDELTHTLSSEEAALIRLGLSYSELTGGAFDITCEPLRQLWDISAELFSVPTEEAVTQALSLVRYGDIVLNDNLLSFGREGMMLGTTELLNGYIMEQVIASASDHSMTDYLLQFGSLTYYAGAPDGQPHTVRLNAPQGEASTQIATLSLTNYAVAAANVYDLYYEEDGTLYHPLYNLQTGYPSNADFVSVFVISSSPSLAEAAALACYSLTMEEGNAMLSGLPDTYAIYLRTDGTVFCTDGLTEHFTVTFP